MFSFPQNEYQSFIQYFYDSLILFQHDKEAFLSKETTDPLHFTYSDGIEKQKQGFAPMYSINSFHQTEEDIKNNLALYVKNRGEKATLPTSVRFKENLKKIQACFLDLDLRKEGETIDIDQKKKEVFKKLQESPLRPTLIVVTKNGMQVIWLIDDEYHKNPLPEYLELYEEVELGIIEWSKTLGGIGDKVKDVCRIFRLPGFDHLKNPKNPFPITWWNCGKPQSYALDELYDFFAPYIPQKQQIQANTFAPVTFGAKNSFNLRDEINSHVDIRDAVVRSFQAVGATFELDRDNYRWIIEGRLTGNFFSKEGKNIACTTSGKEPFSGPPFAVIIQIFKAYSREPKDALLFMNETWGKQLENTYKTDEKKAIEENIDTHVPRFGTEQKTLINDFLSRRFFNYYSWGMEEVDRLGGLLTLGRIAVIGGQHGGGKTTLITEIAKVNSITKKTMLIPLEMGTDFTLMMLAVNLYNNQRNEEMEYMSYGDVEEGYLYQRPENEKNLFVKCVHDVYEKYPNLYVRTPLTTKFEELKVFVEKYHNDEKINFFIVDHLHQLDTSEIKDDNETQFYSNVAKELKELAERLNIAMLCVVQLTKSANMKGADIDLSSFKGTSEFTSNAHRVVALKRPTYKETSDSQVKKMLFSQLGRVPTDEEITLKISELERLFIEKTRHIRELLFLKTRGRDGGMMTIEMTKGQFKFLYSGRFLSHS